MPNIEIHGLEKKKAEEVKNLIFLAFRDKPYVDDMVVTIHSTKVKDKYDKDQPYLRLANSHEENNPEILGTLYDLRMDIECIEIDFRPKTCEGGGD